MPRTLFRFLSLRPYGNQLLSEGGRLWLAVAAFLVLAMASVEALAWGYMGSAFSEDHGWMVAVALGSLVWLVIFGIDYTLITFDSARHHYEALLTLSDQQASPKLPGWRTRIGRSLPYLMRIGFACLSMYLTAPYLSQLVFSSDIAQQIRHNREAAIAAAREQLQVTHQQRTSVLEQQLEALNNQLTDEVAGRGTSRSGKYGDGPVARSIQSHRQQKQLQVEQEQKSALNELAGFDSAVAANDTARLGKTWKVVLPGDTPREREAQMAVIRLTPSYGEIKWRVYGGMIMLLAALLMLKVLPGSGLPLYFSERMQQEWQRYRHGNFDAWLDDADKSTAEHSIPPSRFEYLMLNGYMQEMWNAEQRRLRHEQMQQRQREMEEELRRQRMEAEARQTLEQERLRRRQAGEEALVQLQQLEGRLHQSLSDKQDIQQAIERKEAEMMTLQAEQEARPDNITTLNQRTAHLHRQLAETEELLEKARANNQHSDIQRMRLLSELTEGYLRLKSEQEASTEQLNQARADYAGFAQKLESLQREHLGLSTQLAGIRQQLQHLQDCQEQLVAQMAGEAMRLGMGMETPAAAVNDQLN